MIKNPRLLFAKKTLSIPLFENRSVNPDPLGNTAEKKNTIDGKAIYNCNQCEHKTRSIGILFNPFNSVSMQINPNFIYK